MLSSKPNLESSTYYNTFLKNGLVVYNIKEHTLHLYYLWRKEITSYQ